MATPSSQKETVIINQLYSTYNFVNWFLHLSEIKGEAWGHEQIVFYWSNSNSVIPNICWLQTNKKNNNPTSGYFPPPLYGFTEYLHIYNILQLTQIESIFFNWKLSLIKLICFKTQN